MPIRKIFEHPSLVNSLIIESMSDGIYCIDCDHLCTFINSSALRMLGFARKECIGKNMHSLMHSKRRNGENYPEPECPICKTFIDKVSNTVDDDVFWKSDGSPLEVRYTSNPVLEHGILIGVVVLFTDISIQKRKDEEILRIKTIQESLINGTTDIIWSIDKNYKLLSCNLAFSELIFAHTGRHLKEGDYTLLEEFGSDYFNKWREYYNRALNGASFKINEQIYDPSKKNFKYSLVSFAPMFDHEGTIFGAACLSKDITETMASHVALIAAYSELDNILIQSKDIICIIDGNGKFRKVSKAAEHILGYKIEELIDKKHTAFIFHDDLDSTKEEVKKLIGGADVNNFENRYVGKNGKIVPLVWSVTWDKKAKLMYCIARDATEKKLSEKMLAESDGFLKEAQKLAKMGSWNFDFKNDVVQWSDELYNVFDIPKNTFHETFGAFIHLVDEKDRLYASQASKHAQETGEPFNIQYHITTEKGEQRVIEEYGYGEKDEHGTVIRLFGTAQDITERKKAEEKIEEANLQVRESEKRYNELFHLSPLPMWVFDWETLRFLDVNNAAIQHYGYSFDEFLSMNIKDIRPPEEIDKLNESLAKNNNQAIYRGIFNHKKKNGEIIKVDIRSSIVDFKGKSAKVIIASDVTERLKYIHTIEEQNEKFREIAWIQSHIVRAPLARIMGFLPLIKGKLIEEHELEKVLEYISLSAHELDEIIRDISSKASLIWDPPK